MFADPGSQLVPQAESIILTKLLKKLFLMLKGLVLFKLRSNMAKIKTEKHTS